ncbi:Ark- serine/threonine protein kinase [Coemansia sp. RSA 2336]|nr:Ark- serine/threonine protein kinase [Coemansia sp. RSA 2336]
MPLSFADAHGAKGTEDAAADSKGLYTQGTMLQVNEQSCVVKRFLSSGGHANVYLVNMLRDGSPRVLKHIPLAGQPDEEEYRQNVEREIQYMTQLNGHANIVALEAAEITDDGAYILMEQCTGDVLSLMNANLKAGLKESQILHIFCDVCKAVAHMHYQQEPLLHRDLKVENILVSSGGEYKLCDFGSVTANLIAPNARLPREQIVRLEEEIQRMTTLEYRAPEMVDLYLQRGVTEKADIWALGVLLYKLCYFRTPFDNASPLAILNAEYFIPASPVYSKELKNIFQMTLREEPRERSNIFTLCSYACSLYGEPCLLENKYALPEDTSRIQQQQQQHHQQQQQHTGLGYISGQPVHQPRRYAASSSRSSSVQRTNADSSRPTSTNSELDSDSIVPMRRGRPPKPAKQNNYSASPSSGSILRPPATGPTRFGGTPTSTGGKLQLSENQAALFSPARTAPKATTNDQPPPAASGSRSHPKSAASDRFMLQIPSSPLPMAADALQSAPVYKSETSDNALGIFPREHESSTAELDGDNGWGAKRAGQMRMSVKAPDGRESLSVDFVQGAVFGSARRSSVLRRNPSVLSSTSSSSRTSRFGGSSDCHGATARSSAAEILDDAPLAPPLGRKSISSNAVSTGPEPSAAPSLPGFVCQPLPPPPLSPAAKDAKAADDGELQAALITPLSLGNASPQTAETEEFVGSSEVGADNVNASIAPRLSTILESGNDDSRPQSGLPAAAQRQQREPIKSIYEMTLDKLENDMRYSVVFDDQPLFNNAKAKYAAQRSSVYQGSGVFDAGHYTQDAQSNWHEISPSVMNSMLDKRDQLSKQSGNEDMLDIDAVLQQAETRNRQKLIAQNNRRSMYITGELPVNSDILAEDVEDNMRVLSDEEIEALLQKMDMYNRELMSEQQKWQQASASIKGDKRESVDMRSLSRIIEHANDQMLRSEQTAPGGILQNVISAAKMTFGKPTADASDLAALPSTAEASRPLAANGDSKDTAVAKTSPVASISVETAVVESTLADVSTAVPESPLVPDTPAEADAKSPPMPDSPVEADAKIPSMPDSPVETGAKPSISAAPKRPAVPESPVLPSPSATTDGPSSSQPKQLLPTQPTSIPSATALSTANSGNSASGTVKAPQPSKIPRLPRMRSDLSTAAKPAATDPLAEVRARLKKKQSSPMLTTTKLEKTPNGRIESRTPEPMPSFQRAVPSPAKAPPPKGKPVKSVRNLVAIIPETRLLAINDLVAQVTLTFRTDEDEEVRYLYEHDSELQSLVQTAVVSLVNCGYTNGIARGPGFVLHQLRKKWPIGRHYIFTRHGEPMQSSLHKYFFQLELVDMEGGQLDVPVLEITEMRAVGLSPSASSIAGSTIEGLDAVSLPPMAAMFQGYSQMGGSSVHSGHSGRSGGRPRSPFYFDSRQRAESPSPRKPGADELEFEYQNARQLVYADGPRDTGGMAGSPAQSTVRTRSVSRSSRGSMQGAELGSQRGSPLAQPSTVAEATSRAAGAASTPRTRHSATLASEQPRIGRTSWYRSLHGISPLSRDPKSLSSENDALAEPVSQIPRVAGSGPTSIPRPPRAPGARESKLSGLASRFRRKVLTPISMHRGKPDGGQPESASISQTLEGSVAATETGPRGLGSSASAIPLPSSLANRSSSDEGRAGANSSSSSGPAGISRPDMPPPKSRPLRRPPSTEIPEPTSIPTSVKNALLRRLKAPLDRHPDKRSSRLSVRDRIAAFNSMSVTNDRGSAKLSDAAAGILTPVTQESADAGVAEGPGRLGDPAKQTVPSGRTRIGTSTGFISLASPHAKPQFDRPQSRASSSGRPASPALSHISNVSTRVQDAISALERASANNGSTPPRADVGRSGAKRNAVEHYMESPTKRPRAPSAADGSRQGSRLNPLNMVQRMVRRHTGR